jgi:hypothetical protein
MRRHLVFSMAVAAVLLGVSVTRASWAFRPSRFSHNPQTAERVLQYAPNQTPYAYGDGTYQQSGYRHMRSAVRGADGNADRIHIVETWGAGEYIRPYGEWLRPYREGATPYGPWGNPQGPWTQPFDSWVNPYGLGQIFNPRHSPGFQRPGYGYPNRPQAVPPVYPGPDYPHQGRRYDYKHGGQHDDRGGGSYSDRNRRPHPNHKGTGAPYVTD